MNTSRNIPWPRILAEVAAIVVSILLAFSIEAWWIDRQARKDECVVMSSVLVEFRKIRESVDHSRIYNEAIRASAKELLQYSQGSGKQLSEPEIDRLLADLWWNQVTAVFTAPELSSVASSGDLALVSNIELRHRLGGWPAKLGFIRNAMQRDLDFFADRLMPFLATNSSLLQIRVAEGHMPGHPGLVYDTSGFVMPKKMIPHSELLAKIEFQNILSEREVLLTDILTLAFDGVEEQLDGTIDLIEEELCELPSE